MRMLVASFLFLACLTQASNTSAETEPSAKASKPSPFFLQNNTISTEGTVPEVCLVFSEMLRSPLSLEPGDYVTVSPTTRVEVLAKRDSLCIRGLAFGAPYKVTVRAGLVSGEGNELGKDQSLDLTVPDRDASTSFSANAYVLPRSENSSIPVTTVNTAELKLTLIRINDRNLVHSLLNSEFGKRRDGWDVEQLTDTSGELVWQGTLKTPGEKNRDTTTLIPLKDLVQQTLPGVYALTAEKVGGEERSWYSRPTQWLIATDMGLSTFEGADGLTVAARSLETAEPLSGVTFKLIARNNKVLATESTGRRGRALFAPGLMRGIGGNRPALLIAENGDDFAFLNLLGPALDLSTLGIGGRPAPGPVDAFLYTERGVYRPGETVRLTALARDSKADAIAKLPLTIKVQRPDGLEAFIATVAGDELGGHHLSIPISPSSPSGTWIAQAFTDPNGDPVGRVDFKVEDFVPQRIELKLETDRTFLTPDERATVNVTGRYLYGAPAANLPAEGELVLRKDPNPFPDHPGYQFGLEQEDYSPIRQTLTLQKSDAEGKTAVNIGFESLPDTSHPLQANIRLSLLDTGGRPVNRTMQLPLRTRDVEVGLKPAFENGAVRYDETPLFHAIALGKEGKPVAGRELNFEWIEEIYDYHWYWDHGSSLNYRVTQTDRSLASGAVTTGADGTAELTRPVDWGRYRLELHDPETGAAAGVRFRAGWVESAGLPDTPDALELVLEKSDLRDSDTLKAFIRAPFAGTASVMVINGSIVDTQEVDLPAEGTTVEIDVDGAWGQGAYVAATAFRARQGNPKLGPGRAMGMAWFSIDKTQRTLAVSFDTPAEVRPNQTVTIPLTVKGGKGPIRVAVAAVDEGILGLTGFATPKPEDHYFSQRQLGMDLRDVYGRLIPPAEGQRGQPRSGGDAAGNLNLAGLGARTVETVALFQESVVVDGSGKASVSLKLPDYNGRLRLMAVAYGEQAVGSGDAPLLVRDPVVADLILPRFLAPGDEATASLSLHNLAGPEGAYQALFTATGEAMVKESRKATLKQGQKETFPIKLKASGVGEGQIAMTLTGPKGLKIKRQWSISVRPAQPYETKRTLALLQPGESLVLDKSFLQGNLDGTRQLSLTMSTRPDFDVPGLLKKLDGYPYGCLEQTISKGFPLLYFRDVAAHWNIDLNQKSIDERINFAIRRTLDRQRTDGAFGLWSPQGEAEEWASSYAVHFLTKARELGYAVPEAPYQRALDWLETASLEGPSLAYAVYNLARTGRMEASTVRYVAERNAASMPTILSKAQLAAALVSVGEKGRASNVYRPSRLTYPDRTAYYRDYGSPLRDGAAVIALAAEAGLDPSFALQAVEDLGQQFEARDYLSTQEMFWLLAATHAVVSDSAEMSLALGKDTFQGKGSIYTAPDEAKVAKGLDVTNKGTGAVRVIQSVTAVPDVALPAVSKGFSISRGYYSLEGKSLDPSQIQQNQMVVVLIEGEAVTKKKHQALIVDLLPAGLEIENASIGDGADTGDLGFLPTLSSPVFDSRRDDRYVAAIDLDEQNSRFAFAYLARAVTPGTYAHPGIYVEDMYKPYYFARGTMGSLTVK